MDSQRPSRVCTLFATATWVCRSVPGTAVAVREGARDQALDVDLPDALRPGPAEQGMLLDEGQRVLWAAWWACSIAAATALSATAHNVDTDFTGENVKS